MRVWLEIIVPLISPWTRKVPWNSSVPWRRTDLSRNPDHSVDSEERWFFNRGQATVHLTTRLRMRFILQQAEDAHKAIVPCCSLPNTTIVVISSLGGRRFH